MTETTNTAPTAPGELEILSIDLQNGARASISVEGTRLLYEIVMPDQTRVPIKAGDLQAIASCLE